MDHEIPLNDGVDGIGSGSKPLSRNYSASGFFSVYSTDGGLDLANSSLRSSSQDQWEWEWDSDVDDGKSDWKQDVDYLEGDYKEGEHKEDGICNDNFDKTLASVTSPPLNRETQESLTLDLLYHDTMTHILSYLPLDSLASFSCTAVRPNVDAYRFFKLQMEHAVLQGVGVGTGCCGLMLAPGLSDTHLLSRLAGLDPEAARGLLREFVTHRPRGEHGNVAQIASAVFTMLGAARYACESDHQVEMMAMLSMGMAGMMVRRAVAEQKRKKDEDSGCGNNGDGDGGNGESSSPKSLWNFPNVHLPHLPHIPQLPHLPHLPNLPTPGESVFPHAMLRIMHGFASMAPATSATTPPFSTFRGRDGRRAKRDPAPSELSLSRSAPSPVAAFDASSSQDPRHRPVGPAGMYRRTLKKCEMELRRTIRARRLARFSDLCEPERFRAANVFIDACTTNDLVTVKQAVANGMDVDGFYGGGPEGLALSCGLHAAASNGAEEVLEYLCRGIGGCAEEDGGLANMNLIDDNGWTACHYATACNSVEGIRVLALGGARLNIEAGNGYTPYHWAEKLGNVEAADELRKLGADERFLITGKGVFGGYWGYGMGVQQHIGQEEDGGGMFQ
mmetsp:Transcript_11345/g.22459  ORF Transcript_11345/g.22459 Transcript_11345/m.22459 type:complete len:616 (+) Transcript_11345:86-1933(+)